MNLSKKFKKSIQLVVLCLISGSLIPSCMPQVSKDNDKKSNILVPFIKKKEKQTDLYVMDINGQNKVQLTNDVFEEADPIVMPSTGKIIFSSKRTGTWQIYMIDPDGTNFKAVTTDKAFNNYRPALAIDGSLLFVSDREVKPKIFSMDPDGKNVLKLTDGDNYYDYPSPLDDGTILYLSNEQSKWEIWKMGADGSNKQKITISASKPISLSAMPAYVRDSQLQSPGLNDSFAELRRIDLINLNAKAVFTSRDKKGDLEIFRVNVDGTDLRNLTQMPGVDSNPVVLRNGKIVFTSDRDGILDVWLMESDGYNPVNLTRDPYYASTR